MIKQGIHAFNGKRVLLLQGPVGPFFRRLSKDLAMAGARVFKVNFNGGDCLFYPTGAIIFRGRREEWPKYFEDLLARLNIDVVLLFGDCRPLHRLAGEIAKRRGLELGVFEEGYIRPDYITFEQFGVNGNSRIPRTPSFYQFNARPMDAPPIAVGNTYWYSVLWVCLYYIAASLLKPVFWRYAHHRPLTVLETLPWLRSVCRKAYYALKERGAVERIISHYSKQYFLVPLQVHNDAQIVTHSGYDSVADFICHVVESFANHASNKTVLVIKHHPMDRAYFDYTRLLRKLIVKHHLRNRCIYLHDQHVPTLLKHARGVVVVNSTVGLSALYHKAPVKVCGTAMYDMKGLTYQGSLAHFWRQAHQERPDQELYKRFVGYLTRHTQLNGSIYKRLPGLMFKTGLCWTSEHTTLTEASHL